MHPRHTNDEGQFQFDPTLLPTSLRPACSCGVFSCTQASRTCPVECTRRNGGGAKCQGHLSQAASLIVVGNKNTRMNRTKPRNQPPPFSEFPCKYGTKDLRTRYCSSQSSSCAQCWARNERRMGTELTNNENTNFPLVKVV